MSKTPGPLPSHWTGESTLGDAPDRSIPHGDVLTREPSPPTVQRDQSTRRPVWSWRKRYAAVVAGCDALALLLGWFAAELVVFQTFGAKVAGTSGLAYTNLGLLATVGWVTSMALVGGYDRRAVGVSTDEYRRVCRGVVQFAALIAVIAFFTRLRLSRSFVASATIFAALLTLAFRHGLRVWLHRQRLKGRFTKRVVVVGSGAATTDLVAHLQHSPVAEMRVVGACIPRNDPAGSNVGVPVLGAPTEVWTAAIAAGAETIAIADTATLSARAVQQLAWHVEGQGIEVMVVPAVTDVAGPLINVRLAAGLPLLYLDEPHLSFLGRVVKGTFDRVAAAIGLVLLLPVLALIGLLVRLTSPGPAVFKQIRIGVEGRPFRIWKFRTMTIDAERRLHDVVDLNQHDGLLFKIRDDPRVTRVGRVLRKWSLDELPQLWNILCGQMSLVGPRPPLPSEVDRYDLRIRRRLRVKPGLTGVWQVSGRSDLPWEEGVRLDLHYIESWSLTTDLVIIAKTVKAVILRDGAC